MIDSDENGIQKITDTLNGREDISAIHILSHGSAGGVSLGNMSLTADNLVTFQDQLQAWGESLTADADILIYGCNVGQDFGFVQNFADYTGADVAASDDLTGDSNQGGDAILEVEAGIVETAEVLEQQAYDDAEVSLVNAPVIMGDDGLDNQAVDDNSSILPFSTLTLTDADTADDHDVSIIIKDGVTNGDFSFVVFEDSFEDPDITGSTTSNPTGWIEKGHPKGLGIIDVDTGLFTTDYGSQALTTWRGSSEGATTTEAHLNIAVTFGKKYDLSFNVSHKSSSSYGDFRAELINIDSLGTVTVLNSLSGIANLTDMSESFALSYTPSSDLAGRLAIRFYDDSVGNYKNAPIIDNVKLEVTDSPSGWVRLVQGNADFTGGTNDIQYKRTFTGGTSIADAQAAIRDLVFKPIENKVIGGLTEEITFTISVDDSSLLVANDAEISVVSTLINDAPVIGGGPGSVNLNQTNTTLSVSGSFTVEDADIQDTVIASHTVAVTGFDQLSNTAYKDMFVLTPTSVLDTSATSGSLAWVFNSGSETFEYLAAGETLVLVYTVTVMDNFGVPASDTETVTITITGTNEATSFVDDGLADQAVNDNSQVAPFSKVTFSDDDINDSHQISIVIKDGVNNGDFNNANSIGVADFIAFTDSFEGPDITNETGVDPDGWSQSGHPGAVGLEDVVGGEFTTPYGSQGLKLYRSAPTGATTEASHLSTVVTAGKQYDLHFNVSKHASRPLGDFTAQLINIDSSGVETILNSMSGIAYESDMSETFFLSYTASSTLDGRIAIRFMDEYVGHYKNTPIIDNVKLRVTDSPGSWLKLVAGDENFTGEANDIQYKAIFNGETSAAAAQTAVQSLVFEPIENKVTPGLTEKTTFTIEVNDSSLIVANDAEISVISTSINDVPTGEDQVSTSINDVPTGEDQVLTSTESGVLNSTVSSDTLNDLLRGSADLDYGSSIKVGTVTGNGGAITVTDDADNAGTAQTISVTLTDTAPASGVEYDVSVLVNPNGTYTVSSLDQLPAGVTAAGTFTFTLVDDQGGNSASLTVALTITGTNDAPVIISVDDGNAFVGITEDDITNTGKQVSDLVVSSDADAASVEGMAINSVTATNGTWQFQTAGSGPWQDIVVANLAGDGALHLANDDRVRFLPDEENGSTSSSITFRAWDETSGDSSGDYVDVAASDTGKGTAYSVNTGKSTITVSDVNDAPVISGVNTSATLDEDSTSAVSGSVTVEDIDHSDVVIATISPSIALGGSASGHASNPTASDLFHMLGVTPAGILSSAQTSGVLTWTFTPVDGAFSHLAVGETLILTYTIIATDNASPSESGSKTIVITIEGSGDAPEISVEAGNLDADTLLETDSGLSTSGTLTVTDADTTDTVSAEVTEVVESGGSSPISNSALLAMLSVPTIDVLDNTGTTAVFPWTFDSGSEAFDYLNDGETLILTYTITVTDSQGKTATQTVTISIVGENDFTPSTVEARYSIPAVETSLLSILPAAFQGIIRGNSLSFFSQHSDLQFDVKMLNEDALVVVDYIFNGNFLIEEEVADSETTPGDGVIDMQVYDISQLPEEEQEMIYKLLFGENEIKGDDTLEDAEADEGVFLIEEEVLLEMAAAETEPRFSQDDLDKRVNLEDTFVGDFDCLNV